MLKQATPAAQRGKRVRTRRYHSNGRSLTSLARVREDGMILCLRCGEYKDRGEFGRTRRCALGLQSYCAACCAAWVRERYRRRVGIPVDAPRYQHYKGHPILAEDVEGDMRASWFLWAMDPLIADETRDGLRESDFVRCLEHTGTGPIPAWVREKYQGKGAADVA